MSHGDLTKKNIQEAKLPLQKIYMIMKSITTIHSWKELSSLFTLEKIAILRNRLLKGSVTVTSTVLQARKRKIIRTSSLLAFPQKKEKKRQKDRGSHFLMYSEVSWLMRRQSTPLRFSTSFKIPPQLCVGAPPVWQWKETQHCQLPAHNPLLPSDSTGTTNF